MLRRLAGLDNFDVRWLYLALIASIVLAYFIKVPIRIQPSPQTQGYVDAIEMLDGSKPVLLHSDWDQGTIGELREQFRNTVRQLFAKNIRFAIISGIQTGRQFYEPMVEELARQYGKEYGRDWVSFGFKMPDPKGIAIEALARDFQTQVALDDRGMPAKHYPWLRKVRVAEDWGLVITISYQEYREYITYFYIAARTPLVCGVASISSTQLYPFLTSGTVKGMLVGARGGGEYEQAMGDYGFGTKFLLGQSAGHLLILVAVILGNLGSMAANRLRGSDNPYPAD